MKSIVIIGASSGIGRRVALDFARYGMRVGIAARRGDRLREIKDMYPDRVEYAEIDVTSDDAVDKFLDLVKRLGGMDIMLYAAGCGWYNPDLNEADTRRTIDVNVTGMTAICNAAYRYFKAKAGNSRGRIAVITSVAATRGLGISAAYSASKSYQQKYLQALDQLAHMQHVNVGITDIRPGFIDTDLLNDSRGLKLPMVMSLDHAAPRIEAAILRGKRVATVDFRWRVLNALWNMVPGALWSRIGVTF